jgi:hypothetical protein
MFRVATMPEYTSSVKAALPGYVHALDVGAVHLLILHVSIGTTKLRPTQG